MKVALAFLEVLDLQVQTSYNVSKQADLLTSLGVSDYNKCSKARALELNKKLAKFFHCNAIPFNLVESDELADFVNALCPAYYKRGLPGRFWMATTGVDLIHKDVHEEVEAHLQSCDALMANMDDWENEKNNNLRSSQRQVRPRVFMDFI